jgi:uncharacterized DUF497 family protein
MIRFEWDEEKNQINQSKHGIDFETAKLIFDDPFCVTFVERVSSGEERWHAIGSIEEHHHSRRGSYVSGGWFGRSDPHHLSPPCDPA